MKKMISKTLLLLAAFIAFCCSEEKIAPRNLELTEDLETSATAYSPNVFVAEITTTKYEGSELSNPVSFELAGSGGKVSINWGDGTIEKVTLTPGLKGYSHEYDRVKNYNIKIDGDIKNIEFYGMAWQDGVIVRNFHFSGLTGLKELDLLFIMLSPEIINLSHNRLLERLTLGDLPTTRDIIMPSTNNLSDVNLTGSVQLTTAAVDRVIDRVYQSVVSNPRSGSIDIKKTWWDTGNENEMVGPPSAYSLTKLRKLRDTHGWSVIPDPDNN